MFSWCSCKPKLQPRSFDSSRKTPRHASLTRPRVSQTDGYLKDGLPRLFRETNGIGLVRLSIRAIRGSIPLSVAGGRDVPDAPFRGNAQPARRHPQSSRGVAKKGLGLRLRGENQDGSAGASPYPHEKSAIGNPQSAIESPCRLSSDPRRSFRRGRPSRCGRTSGRRCRR